MRHNSQLKPMESVLSRPRLQPLQQSTADAATSSTVENTYDNLSRDAVALETPTLSLDVANEVISRFGEDDDRVTRTYHAPKLVSDFSGLFGTL